jgi:putative hemolysin
MRRDLWKIRIPGMPRSLHCIHPSRVHCRKKAFSLVQGGIERTLFLKELNNIYEGITEKEDARKFIDQALTALNVTYDSTGLEARSIPPEGPLVVIANHPFGGLEGLILASILLGVRPDTKLMANYLLARIPQLRTIVFPVDPFERKESTLKNLKPLKDSITWLKADHVVVIFPAGAVSYLSLQERRVIDPKWYESVAKIVRKSGADVLPVFFTGANSTLFQIAGLLHAHLKTALLPRELLNKRNKKIIVRIGRPIPFRKLNTFTDDEKLMAYLRMRTYTLKYRCQEVPDKEGGIMLFNKRSTVEPYAVLPSSKPELVAEEVNRLPSEQELL